MKALLYCTKGKPYLVKGNNGDVYPSCSCSSGILDRHLNGKIVAEVEIDKVEEIVATKWDVGCGCAYYQFKTKDLLIKSCLNYIDLNDYLDRNNGYALHLTNLKVFDRPLSFDKDYIYKDYKTNATLTKAPQNMCNVYDRFGNKYVLISIQPQHLCKILNGEKTIEIRRKVLNCLKEMCKDE